MAAGECVATWERNGFASCRDSFGRRTFSLVKGPDSTLVLTLVLVLCSAREEAAAHWGEVGGERAPQRAEVGVLQAVRCPALLRE